MAAAAETFDVFVVDDETETREVLAEFCRTLGLAVTSADDGRSAVTAIQRSPAHREAGATERALCRRSFAPAGEAAFNRPLALAHAACMS